VVPAVLWVVRDGGTIRGCAAFAHVRHTTAADLLRGGFGALADHYRLATARVAQDASRPDDRSRFQQSFIGGSAARLGSTLLGRLAERCQMTRVGRKRNGSSGMSGAENVPFVPALAVRPESTRGLPERRDRYRHVRARAPPTRQAIRAPGPWLPPQVSM
jgi:hypothetical protein